MEKFGESVEMGADEERKCGLVISAHADERIKERMAGMKSARRRRGIAEAAYVYGLRLEESTGAARAYIQSYKKSKPEYADRVLSLYSDAVFVFEGNCLVTMLPYNSKHKRRLEYNRFKRRQARAEHHGKNAKGENK